MIDFTKKAEYLSEVKANDEFMEDLKAANLMDFTENELLIFYSGWLVGDSGIVSLKQFINK